MIVQGVDMAVDFRAIGQRIKQKRQARGMTQENLAEALACSVGYISNMERGTTKISLTTLAKIADALHCDLGELVVGTSMRGEHYLDFEFEEIISTLDEKEKQMLLHLLKTYIRNRDV